MYHYYSGWHSFHIAEVCVVPNFVFFCARWQANSLTVPSNPSYISHLLTQKLSAKMWQWWFLDSGPLTKKIWVERIHQTSSTSQKYSKRKCKKKIFFFVFLDYSLHFLFFSCDFVSISGEYTYMYYCINIHNKISFLG